MYRAHRVDVLLVPRIHFVEVSFVIVSAYIYANDWKTGIEPCWMHFIRIYMRLIHSDKSYGGPAPAFNLLFCIYCVVFM